MGVCSFLGMGREGESGEEGGGEEREGGGAGCWVCGPLESADWGWHSVPWKEKRERKL